MVPCVRVAAVTRHRHEHVNARRHTRAVHFLLAAQFCSALADNALLIVTIAMLQARGLPEWWSPLLKVGFTASYVLLAPLAGPLADGMRKGRLMAWMNGVKIAGVVGLLAGVHPLAAFALVGLGAAVYAPAKYGLVTELVPAQGLVAANAWLEVSVVCAVLLGTGLGGLLVAPGWLAWSGGLQASVVLLLAVYALAALLNLGVPDSGARYAAAARAPLALSREFLAAHRTLWRDREGGMSLAATTLFWGVGATLQFVVLHWSQQVLGLTLDRGALLQAVVALGVIAGAAAAGRWVPLSGARRMLGAGIGLGLMLPLVAGVTHVVAASALLAVTGALAGLMVVPLNALLQHRGCTLLSAGRSIAVQGFNENASVLAMLAGYALLMAAGAPIRGVMVALGLAVSVSVAWIAWRHRR